MKRIFLLSMLVMAGFFAGAQTVLPNGSFEQWTGNKPTGWDASNFQVSIFTIQTVFRDTVLPIDGTSNPLVQTKTFNLGLSQPTVPGILTLGHLNIDLTTFTGSVEGGIPFQGRPDKLVGFINAQPSPGDSAMIAIGFSKWDGTKRDTIGYGLEWYATPHNEWVALEVPITFTDPQTPDSLNIVISSSAVGSQVVVAGSQLRVDKLAFDYGTVVVEQSMESIPFSVWADKERNLHYTLRESSSKGAMIQIFQVNGSLVRSVPLTPGTISGSVNIGDLCTGVYLIGMIQEGMPARGVRIFVR
jgi:hypothetical protein